MENTNITNCKSYVQGFLEDTLLNDVPPYLPFYNSFMNSCLIHPNAICQFSSSVNTNQINILSLNCRGLKSSLVNLLSFLDYTNLLCNVICLSETWLDGSFDDFCNINNYNFYKSNRTFKKGGGVALYIDKNYIITERHDLTINNNICEIVAVEILAKNGKNIIILNLYKPPSTNNLSFLNFLESFLIKISLENKIIYFLGDFNININTYNSASINLLNLMASFLLYPTNSIPTRTTNTSSSNIDLIFTNNLSAFLGYVIETDISDHNAIFIKQQCFLFNSKLIGNKDIVFNNMTVSNVENLKLILWQENWNDIFLENDLNLAFNSFLNKLNKFYIATCPFTIKKLKKSKFHNPWFTPEIKKLIYKKNKLFKKYKLTKNVFDHNNYKNFRNKINKIIVYKKKKFYEDAFAKTKSNPKETWKHISALINRTNDTSKNMVINYNNVIHHNSQDISNIFNNYFSNLFNKSSIINSTFVSYIKNKPNETFYIFPTNPNEIISIVSKFSNSNAKDIYNISNAFLKKIIEPLAHILSFLFNRSFEIGVFPDCLKKSKVVPIFKSGSPQDITNYRPISIIPSIAKIIEKIMEIRLTSFFNKHKILTNQQFGFRKGRSTELALIAFLNDIYINRNNNQHTLAVFIDFSKAFDSINHQILIKKLELYGLKGLVLNWFRSYLSKRQQSVKINSTNSNFKYLDSGVPQGSILGPILFNLYINDIVFSSHDLHFVIYADDTTVYNSSDNINDLFSNMSKNLDRLNEWATANQLLINTKKTKSMLFKYSKKFTLNKINLKLGNFDIEIVETFKLLGVIIDHSLTFKDHINNISKKINKNLGVINRLKFYLTKSTILTLYYSLIFPYIFYCNIIWGFTYKTYLHSIFSTQKRFIYIIKNSTPETKSLTNNISSFFNKFNILTIFELNVFKVICFYFDFVRNKFLFIKLPLKNDNKFTRLVSKNNLIQIYRANNVIVTRNILYYGVPYWNNLPDYIKNCNNYVAFKNLLKTYLNCFS